MRIWGKFFSKKWLILGWMCLLVPLFQNMSPTDQEIFDIRERAPSKPAGEWDRPMAAYFPRDFSADSLGDIQQSMLSHNFDPLLKDLELTYFSESSDSSRPSHPEGILRSKEHQENLRKWQVGLINPTKLRLSFENLESGSQFKVTCEAQAGDPGLALKMFRPVTSKLNLGISHQTGQRQSQIQMDYHW